MTLRTKRRARGDARAGCTLDFVVGDADALFEFQRSPGVEIVAEPDDRPYGLRDYAVRDRSLGRYIYTHSVTSRSRR